MLRRVQLDGVPLPVLYLAENAEDIRQAKAHGIPYIKWSRGHDQFIRYLLRPTIERLFPGISWHKVLGPKRPIKSQVIMVPGLIDEGDHQIAEYDAEAMLEKQLEHTPETNSSMAKPDDDGYYNRLVDVAMDRRDIGRDFSDEGYDSFEPDRLSVYEYIGDISSYVDIDILQKLKLLPKFVGDVADCIRANLSDSMYWTEGYNKKLGFPLGNIRSRGSLPNLIIIDCSHSIPDGIASTMLTLADTLREQCNAELIITSKRSGYYPIGAQLPTPQTLREYYGRSNEGAEFWAILGKYIAGREFGHVISFGDNDNPAGYARWQGVKIPKMESTKVHAVHHFHTWSKKATGYAQWVHQYADPDEVEYNTSWCNVMK